MDLFKLFAVVVAGTLWSAWFVLFLREKGVNPTRELLDRFSRLGWFCKVGVLFLVVQMTMFGGAKHGGTNDVDDVTGTNEVEIVGGGGQSNLTSCVPRLSAPSGFASQRGIFGMEEGMTLHCPPPPLLSTSGISLADVVRGYRLESVATNDDISYTMPSNGMVRGTWHLTGAYEDVQKVELLGSAREDTSSTEAFRFPLGTNLCESMWVYTWGRARPQLKNTENEIAPVGAPMSAVPSVSRFWTMATTNDTYLLTWENFALGRIPASTNASSLVPHPSSLVSAQLELGRNGDFITRSNNVESVYRRVIEPNPIGPVNPPDPEDPTMPLHPYGPVQDLSVIEETNAYCWVDIVVDADAWVRFEGDGPSNLADPSFAAKAGEVNHVVILIGKTYKVTCDMQFSIVAKSDPAIDEWWEDDRTLWLNWPVTIEAWEGNGNSFRMYVDPSGLGGTFVWTESDCPLGGSGSSFTYSCDTNSLCPGCAAKGHYDYEGYEKDCTGGWCGCSYVPVEPDVLESEPDDGPYAGGASVSFSDAAVIFEDGYVNMPDEFVPRQSTRTTLSCVAHGGANGGTATFSISGDDKLVRVSGRSLPVTVTVPPEQRVAFEIVYEGKEPSGSERDIVATATFTEEDSQPSSSDATLISVKVEVEAAFKAPRNDSKNRHVYGVGESAVIKFQPQSAVMAATATHGEILGPNNGQVSFEAPAQACSPSIEVSFDNVSKTIDLDVFEPDGYVVNDVEPTFFDAPNEAGLFRLDFDLKVYPQEVSFYAIEIKEVPAVSTDAIGYFAQPEHADDLDHGKRGARGKWDNVGSDNSSPDIVQFGYCAKPWNGGGSYTWPIPNAWRISGKPSTEKVFTRTDQRFELDADGTARVFKFGYMGERSTNNQYRVVGGN